MFLVDVRSCDTMEDRCAAVNWTQYHVQSASYVPWYHYAPPASFYQQHHSYNYVGPQEGYGVYQPQLWDYHTRAWPDTAGQASKQAAPVVGNKIERSESEACVLDECHDPLPMDISPPTSPAPSISTKSPTKCAGSELKLKSDLLCSSPTKPSMLTTMQFSSIKISETSAPVLSLLATCNACMKKMLATATGTGPVNESCTCPINLDKAIDQQKKSGSSSRYEPSKVQNFECDSIMKQKPKAITMNDMAEPRKRVVVQQVNGVARLITFSNKFPVSHNVQNAQSRNTGQSRLFTTHKGQQGPSSAGLNFSKHCLKQKSTISKDPRKASPKIEKECAKKFVGPSKTASACAKSSYTSAQTLKNRSARRKRQRMRKREKCLRLLNAEQSLTANKVCSFAQPANLASTDAELLVSSTSMQKSSGVSHSATESANNSLETMQSSTKSSIDISSRMSEDKPVKPKREDCRTGSLCAGDIRSSTRTGVLSTNDMVVGGNVMGIWDAPKAEVDRELITSIEMCVDPELGGYMEHVDRSVSFISQLEKLDEGWECFFD